MNEWTNEYTHYWIHIVQSFEQLLLLLETFVGSFTPGNWVKGKLLGRGAFGQVFTGYDPDRGVEFAVKQVQIYSQSNEVIEVSNLRESLSALLAFQNHLKKNI